MAALVQLLKTPALKPVFDELLESECDIYLIPAQLVLDLGTYTFGQIARLVQKQGAVALGELTPSCNLPLLPRACSCRHMVCSLPRLPCPLSEIWFHLRCDLVWSPAS